MLRRKEWVDKPYTDVFDVWEFYPGELDATVQFPSLQHLEQRLMESGNGKYCLGMWIKTESPKSDIPWMRIKCMPGFTPDVTCTNRMFGISKYMSM